MNSMCCCCCCCSDLRIKDKALQTWHCSRETPYTHTHTYKQQTFSGVQLPTSLCSLILGIQVAGYVSVCVCANISVLACCVLLDPGSIWITQAVCIAEFIPGWDTWYDTVQRGVNQKNIPTPNFLLESVHSVILNISFDQFVMKAEISC